MIFRNEKRRYNEKFSLKEMFVIERKRKKSQFSELSFQISFYKYFFFLKQTYIHLLWLSILTKTIP